MIARRAARIAPGLALCGVVALAALAVEAGETAVLGRAWLDALVLAIVIGAGVRTLGSVPARASDGIDFAARPVLETAIVLLGVTLDLPLLLRAGPALLLAIVIAVLAAFTGAYGIGRLLGLHPRLAALVATGNAICGNTAIAAAAPVVGAEAEDVAAAISFTAVLGVLVVLLLPLASVAMALDDYQYGVVAGLTVYAVPQVLAATLPVSALSGDVGTVVKLTRVLLLGPLLVVLGTWARRTLHAPGSARTASRPSFVPWFIVGFVALAVLRSVGGVPEIAVAPAREVSRALTIVALAALGLGVDFRGLRRVGPAVAAAAAGGVMLLGAVAVVLVRTLLAGA